MSINSNIWAGPDQYLSDDADALREVSNAFVRTGILILKFSKCSINVRIFLFKSYCRKPDAALWLRYKIES